MWIAGMTAVAWSFTAAAFQIDNPVYVDDSPQAWELFRQAQDQSRNNAGEAVRLYQELLDEYAFKLIPAGTTSTTDFKSVRAQVLADISQDQTEGGLRDRYRLIQTPAAEAMLQAGELDHVAITRSLTEPGLHAMLQLAQQSLEQGRLRTAQFWLTQSRDHPDLSGTRREQVRRLVHWWHLSGLAAHALGLVADAQSALDALGQLGMEGEACRASLGALIGRGAATEPSALDPLVLDDLVAQAIWSVPLEDSLAARRQAAREAEQADQPFSDPSRPRFGDSPSAAGGSRYRDADLATASAAVSDQIVFINEGHTIRAIHRLTGRQIWQFTNINRISLTERDITASMDMNTLTIVEGPPGGGGCVVTLTGHAQPNGRSEAGRVICLDSETGSLRWSTNLAAPPLIEAPSNEQLFPHGTPVVADGMVFVGARRVSMQAITSAYVVAFDLETGAVRWVRSIASSGGLRAGIRPFDSLVYVPPGPDHSDRSGLYVSTAVGAIARLEPVTGEVAWLSRFSAPINVGIADYIRRPWEIGGPVVTPRGVIAIQPDQRRILLIDAVTGQLLESHDSSSTGGWNQPRYLLADDERVYAIGTEIRAFDLEVLDVPAWRLPEIQKSEVRSEGTEERGLRTDSDHSAPSPQSPVLSSLDLRGRVQLVNGALVIPTTEGVQIVDRRSGAVKNTLALDAVGNPLAVQSQLLLACSDRLDSYMSFGTAQRMLRERIAQQPNDPEPAISLLRLAMRVRNLKLALEASQLAMAALNSAPATNSVPSTSLVRGELVSLLLELAGMGIITTSAEGESVFTAVNAAAIDPAQRVEYLLAYGDWLAGNATAGDTTGRSVEAWQSILSDPLLASSWRSDPENRKGDRPAAAWARERLGQLIETRGANVYAPQADFAAMRLRQLTAAAEPDALKLAALAVEFPFADAGTDAAIRAAEGHARRGDQRAAAAVLLHSYRNAMHGEAATRLVGALIAVCDTADWNTQAESVVQHALKTYGDRPVLIAGPQGDPMMMSAWLMQRGRDNESAGESLHPPPTIGASAAAAQFIAGAIVEPYRISPTSFGSYGAPSSQAYPPDRVLMHMGDSLRLLGPDREPIWTAANLPDRPQLLRFTRRDILLWINTDPQDPRAMMLNAADGSVRWTTPRLDEVLGDAVRDLGRARGVREQMPDGEPFDPVQTIPVVGEHSIFLVQRTGAIAAIDLADGTTVRWTSPSKSDRADKPTLEQVHTVALHDGALILAGMTKTTDGNSTLAPKLIALNPATGQLLLPLPNERRSEPDPGRRNDPDLNDGVKWVRLSPLGELLIGSVDELLAVDVFSGVTLWRTGSYAAADSQRAWMLDDRLILEDQRGRLRLVDRRDGSVSDPFETPLRGEWDPSELRQVFSINTAVDPATGPLDRIIAHYPQRVVMYDPANGAVIGADVISDDRDFRWLLVANAANEDGQARLVLVNSRVQQSPIADQPGRRAQQWIYRLYVLSDNCKVLGDPVELVPLDERVQLGMLIDGTLLLSSQNRTLAIPMVESEGNRE